MSNVDNSRKLILKNIKKYSISNSSSINGYLSETDAYTNI